MADLATRAKLQGAQGFVLDMDGTLVRGEPGGGGLVALPGAVEFLERLRTRRVPYVVFTNGTGRTAGGYAAALRLAGLPVSSQQVLTAADGAAAVCRRRHHRRVMVLAAHGARVTLRAAGVEALRPVAADDVDAVFVGWFPQMRFSHIQVACNAVWRGARLYSSSQTPVFATADGRTVATSRLISEGIRDVTGQRVEVVGKPSSAAFDAAAKRLGCSAGDIVVIGDDPDLEVAMARRVGALAVAVHTGIAGAESFQDRRDGLRPHLSVPSIADVLPLL